MFCLNCHLMRVVKGPSSGRMNKSYVRTKTAKVP